MKRKITNAQRITLIARTAWTRLTSAGAIDEPFDAWRLRESMECVGTRISKASSRELDRLETHFLSLGGQPAKALENELGEDGHTKRTRHAIQLLAEELGLPPDYAATKPASQLKGILINLTRKAREKRKTK